MTTLSAQQQEGIDKIKRWYRTGGWNFNPAVFRLFGPAGTGKTTMAKAIPEALGLRNVRYATCTGKAAHVLRSKGAAPVSTIHSGIYKPTSSREARLKLTAAEMELEDALERGEHQDWVDDAMHEIETLRADAKRVRFEWNPDSEWAMADLIILDEVSMVGGGLAHDIEAYGVPVLVLGDPAQLPPVEGGGHYTEAAPDFLLTEIHRQALESPVLSLANRIRTSTDAGFGINRDELRPASVAAAMEYDQILCWSNKRRWALIEVIRRKLGRPAGVPVEGDKIMCLTNNKDLAVFNGQQFTVLACLPGVLGPTLTVRDDDGHTQEIPCYDDGFAGREMQDQAKSSGAGREGMRMLATFAQAITVHKAQGSQYGSVYVVNETPGIVYMNSKSGSRAAAIEQARRWMYTAASRAEHTVTITAAK